MRMLVSAVLPVERREPQAGRVERRQERGADAERPEPVEPGIRGARVEGDGQDFPFREEAAEGHDAGEGETSEEHDLRGDGQRFRETAHLSHVVRVDRVDYAPGAEEQEGLEERVVEQMVQRRAVSVAVYRLPVG